MLKERGGLATSGDWRWRYTATIRRTIDAVMRGLEKPLGRAAWPYEEKEADERCGGLLLVVEEEEEEEVMLFELAGRELSPPIVD